LLSNLKMQAHYDAVTWLFVSRNFKDDEKDREAARTHDRFGVTSWPQLVLFDPRDDKVLAEMPRGFEPWVKALQPFRGAVPAPSAAGKAVLDALAAATALAATDRQGAMVQAEQLAATPDGTGAWLAARELLRTLRGDERTLAERLQDPDVRQRALCLEALADLKDADVATWLPPVTARLLDPKEHIVVQLRALAWLCKHRPEVVVEHARALLAVENDAFRNLVLAQVAVHPDPALAPLLSAMFAGAGGAVKSNNPNVLRGYVARCFAGSGDASALDAVAELLQEANARNSTTKMVVQALAGLAPRLAEADHRRLLSMLLQAMPAAVPEGGADTDRRLSLSLVQELHKALAAASGAGLPALPTAWQAPDRERYLQAVRQALAH